MRSNHSLGKGNQSTTGNFLHSGSTSSWTWPQRIDPAFIWDIKGYAKSSLLMTGNSVTVILARCRRLGIYLPGVGNFQP